MNNHPRNISYRGLKQNKNRISCFRTQNRENTESGAPRNNYRNNGGGNKSRLYYRRLPGNKNHQNEGEIDKAFKAIFTKLQLCFFISVQAESQRIKNALIQCHRVFPKIHVTFKFMKCGAGTMTGKTFPQMRQLNNRKEKKFVELPIRRENVWLKRDEERKKVREVSQITQTVSRY